MRQSKFPPGWDEERVEKVLAHYETQSEEEAVAEDEAVFEAPGHTVRGSADEVGANSPRAYRKARCRLIGG